MPRKVSKAGLRDRRTSTALSATEMGRLDAMRGALDRSEFLRWLVNDAHRRGVSFGRAISPADAAKLLDEG